MQRSADSGPGETAVVTGAGRGFGSAIAAALVDQGHQVVGVARTADALADVRRRLGPAFVGSLHETYGLQAR